MLHLWKKFWCNALVSCFKGDGFSSVLAELDKLALVIWICQAQLIQSNTLLINFQQCLRAAHRIHLFKCAVPPPAPQDATSVVFG